MRVGLHSATFGTAAEVQRVRIAQVSPLYESVPPKLYGGTERVVFYLTEELVRQGHDVTLFASGDSRTSAALVPCCARALRLDRGAGDPVARHLLMVERVAREAHRFDVVHFHVDYLHFPVSRRLGVRQVTTLHGRLDLPDQAGVYREFRDMPLISISAAQRRSLRGVNWCGTVHHGLPLDRYTFHPGAGEYLAFLGRISPEKRVDRAIEIARRVGMPLRIAAKIDRTDREYFECRIRPLFEEPFVEYLGEIGETEKNEFLGRAAALLFPIDWNEPFGLAMIEAMACGTPVVAWRGGSVQEVVTDGVTGYVVESLRDAVQATRRAAALSRRRCRALFERRFSVSRMARDYLRVYRSLASRPAAGPHPAAAARRRARAA
jgi:glycosyltransferase involved in cell wall biosynthesis